MPKLIILIPQSDPRVEDHDGEVTLEILKRYIGEDRTVDVIRLGTIPPVGRHVDLWIDDEGLLDAQVLPNRELPSGAIICGPMVLCSAEGPESVGLEEEEIDFLLADIAARWRALPADYPKPEPFIGFGES